GRFAPARSASRSGPPTAGDPARDRPGPPPGPRSKLFLGHERAVEAAHVLPAHLGGLPHLVEGLLAHSRRGAVPLDDLVSPLAVYLVGLDVDPRELPPPLVHALPAHSGRGAVRRDDLVSPLAVYLVGLDVDREELHLAVVEAVVRPERRQVALVDPRHLRFQADEQAGGGDVERP